MEAIEELYEDILTANQQFGANWINPKLIQSSIVLELHYFRVEVNDFEFISATNNVIIYHILKEDGRTVISCRRRNVIGP